MRREDVVAWVDMSGVKIGKSAAQKVFGVNTRVLEISGDEEVVATAVPEDGSNSDRKSDSEAAADRSKVFVRRAAWLFLW